MKILKKKIGNNELKQYHKSESEEFVSVDDVVDSWCDAVTIKQSKEDSEGLRPAQFGALCAIKSHWTVSGNPATVVMPT